MVELMADGWINGRWLNLDYVVETLRLKLHRIEIVSVGVTVNNK